MSAVLAPEQRARRRVVGGIASLLLLGSRRAASADSSARVTLIIPAAAGVSTDRLGRIVAEGLSGLLESEVRVANVSGDSGVTGTNAIAAGAHDGSVIGLAIGSAMIGGKLLSRAAKFNPVDDFEWLAIFGTFPTAMVIPAKSPYHNLNDWLAAARNAPSMWVYASAGTGSAGHLAGAYLRLDHGAKLIHRPLESLDDGYALLEEGKIDALFDGIPNAMIEVPRSGHRIVAVTSAARVAALPDVPSFGELWGRSFDVWIGLVTPKGLDNAAYLRLASAVGAMLGDSRYADRMRAAGLSYIGLSGRATLTFLDNEILRNAKLISVLNQEGQRN